MSELTDAHLYQYAEARNIEPGCACTGSWTDFAQSEGGLMSGDVGWSKQHQIFIKRHVFSGYGKRCNVIGLTPNVKSTGLM